MKFKITSPIIEPTEGSPHQLTQTHDSRFTSFKTSSPLNALFDNVSARFFIAYRSYCYSFYNFISI
ncbi:MULTISPECIES: hypothetical protein [Vibrio]|uniref:hypothetical protein n=1 Tax=Vibrio TaxID=662 RepID=UPI001056B4F3|nr:MULTISPECIES: hypothetical protein [Vibrio]MCF7502422.1 hypothetical protein [Vibrio sp. L3-7]TVU64506.1 hypothetical protein FQP88_06320 [Vibrio atlanticus]TVU79067.1 hypothetical protein FQP87_01220 [Vibrio tasmaniensis]